jgi:hypothetical protein
MCPSSVRMQVETRLVEVRAAAPESAARMR